MSVVRQLLGSRRDLVEAVAYFAERSERVARRFRAEAEATFERLARMPGLGTRHEPDEPTYADLRYFPISKFHTYLVFYRPLPDGIEVVRVLHGARDIAGVLAEDFGVPNEDQDG